MKREGGGSRGGRSGRGGRGGRGGSRPGGGRGRMGMMRFRPTYCRFCKEKGMTIDYKNIHVLERLINERGKVLSRRITGTCARHQRAVAEAIRRARFLSLLPYTR